MSYNNTGVFSQAQIRKHGQYADKLLSPLQKKGTTRKGDLAEPSTFDYAKTCSHKTFRLNTCLIIQLIIRGLTSKIPAELYEKRVHIPAKDAALLICYMLCPARIAYLPDMLHLIYSNATSQVAGEKLQTYHKQVVSAMATAIKHRNVIFVPSAAYLEKVLAAIADKITPLISGKNTLQTFQNGPDAPLATVFWHTAVAWAALVYCDTFTPPKSEAPPRAGAQPPLNEQAMPGAPAAASQELSANRRVMRRGKSVILRPSTVTAEAVATARLFTRAISATATSECWLHSIDMLKYRLPAAEFLAFLVVHTPPALTVPLLDQVVLCASSKCILLTFWLTLQMPHADYILQDIHNIATKANYRHFDLVFSRLPITLLARIPNDTLDKLCCYILQRERHLHSKNISRRLVLAAARRNTPGAAPASSKKGGSACAPAVGAASHAPPAMDRRAANATAAAAEAENTAFKAKSVRRDDSLTTSSFLWSLLLLWQTERNLHACALNALIMSYLNVHSLALTMYDMAHEEPATHVVSMFGYLPAGMARVRAEMLQIFGVPRAELECPSTATARRPQGRRWRTESADSTSSQSSFDSSESHMLVDCLSNSSSTDNSHSEFSAVENGEAAYSESASSNAALKCASSVDQAPPSAAGDENTHDIPICMYTGSSPLIQRISPFFFRQVLPRAIDMFCEAMYARAYGKSLELVNIMLDVEWFYKEMKEMKELVVLASQLKGIYGNICEESMHRQELKTAAVASGGEVGGTTCSISRAAHAIPGCVPLVKAPEDGTVHAVSSPARHISALTELSVPDLTDAPGAPGGSLHPSCRLGMDAYCLIASRLKKLVFCVLGNTNHTKETFTFTECMQRLLLRVMDVVTVEDPFAAANLREADREAAGMSGVYCGNMAGFAAFIQNVVRTVCYHYLLVLKHRRGGTLDAWARIFQWITSYPDVALYLRALSRRHDGQRGAGMSAESLVAAICAYNQPIQDAWREAPAPPGNTRVYAGNSQNDIQVILYNDRCMEYLEKNLNSLNSGRISEEFFSIERLEQHFSDLLDQLTGPGVCHEMIVQSYQRWHIYTGRVWRSIDKARRSRMLYSDKQTYQTVLAERAQGAGTMKIGNVFLKRRRRPDRVKSRVLSSDDACVPKKRREEDRAISIPS